MLYWITQLLQGQYHAFRVFQYITFRSILAALTALLVGLFCGPPMIRWLRELQIGQMVRTDGPQSRRRYRRRQALAASLALGPSESSHLQTRPSSKAFPPAGEPRVVVWLAGAAV